jgi:3-hydroxy acid dehydrogenase/malonic semialdehyde reductase
VALRRPGHPDRTGDGGVLSLAGGGALEGRTALVTGASSGIGRATALALAGAGARLVLVARRADRLRDLADEIAGAGVEARTVELDVRDRPAVTAALDAAALGTSGAVDVLVNAAGLAAGREPLHVGDADDWDRMLDTNVRGVLNVTRQVLPGMVARGTGRVVNIGSVAGHDTYPDGAVYCATKAALDRITSGKRKDLLGTGVRVSTVDPGLVETEFSVVRFHGDRDRAAGVYVGLTPLTAEDVADAVLWAVTRPAHVQVGTLVLFASDQAGSRDVHRR